MPCRNEDIILIEEIRAGRNSALTELLQSHYLPLLRYIERHYPLELKGLVEPQDILQDTWLQVVRAIDEFHPNEDFFHWLTTIAKHVSTDQARYWLARKRHNVSTIVESSATEGTEKLLEELALYLRTPSASARRHELMIAVDRAIDRLPTAQAKVLRLRHVNGWDLDQVAVEMDRNRESVMSLCKRALKSLRWELRSVSADI
jgi:RNA polymerase sigma factor (sigma-70 family)